MSRIEETKMNFYDPSNNGMSGYYEIPEKPEEN